MKGLFRKVNTNTLVLGHSSCHSHRGVPFFLPVMGHFSYLPPPPLSDHWLEVLFSSNWSRTQKNSPPYPSTWSILSLTDQQRQGHPQINYTAAFFSHWPSILEQFLLTLIIWSILSFLLLLILNDPSSIDHQYWDVFHTHYFCWSIFHLFLTTNPEVFSLKLNTYAFFCFHWPEMLENIFFFPSTNQICCVHQ